MGYDLADPDLGRWSKAINRTVNNLDHVLEGWEVPLKFPPGDGWLYGVAIDWAGQALERVTGLSLSDYAVEHVLGPLGMADTTFYRDSPALAARVRSRTAPCMQRDTAVTATTGTGTSGRVSAVATPVPAEPPVVSGGSGLYTTAADFVKVLQSLLRSLGAPLPAAESESGPESSSSSPPKATRPLLLNRETANEMFRPQLTGTQRNMLEILMDESRVTLAPELVPGARLDYGISGLINLDDLPGKRAKGSMAWLGMCNSHWVCIPLPTTPPFCWERERGQERGV